MGRKVTPEAQVTTEQLSCLICLKVWFLADVSGTSELESSTQGA